MIVGLKYNRYFNVKFSVLSEIFRKKRKAKKKIAI